jgi:hypothetical protein
MKREEVVGRTITRVMRDEVVVEHGGHPFAGISDGVYHFFHVFLELDGRDLIEVGLDRRYYPLRCVSNDIRQQLSDIVVPEGGCIGEVIADVVTINDQIRVRLSSGRYFLVENALHGTEVWLEQPENIPQESLVDYWEGV